MSEFTGSGNRVRCVDCVHLVGIRCARKRAKVKPRKRRNCAIYNFRGEHVNRTTPEAMRVPYVDKSTRRLVKRMADLGIVPVAESPDSGGSFKPLPMPRSTATAGVLNIEQREEASGFTKDAPAGQEEQGFGNPAEPPAAPPVTEKDDESDSSGS